MCENCKHLSNDLVRQADRMKQMEDEISAKAEEINRLVNEVASKKRDIATLIEANAKLGAERDQLREHGERIAKSLVASQRSTSDNWDALVAAAKLIGKLAESV